MKTLILFAHPALEKSRINKVLIKNISSIPNVSFHDLYQTYPDFDIDVEAEQALVEAHDLIIFHHPFFWYSMPAIMKEWHDLVLKHGWAYGSDGNALKDKKILHCITAGGPEAAYCSEGYNGRTMRELLYPIEQSYKLCKMDYLPPFIVHGTHLMEKGDAISHKEDYHKFLKSVSDNSFNFEKASSERLINAKLDSLIKTEGY